MKKVFIFCCLFLSLSGLKAQIRDSVQVNLPVTLGGLKNFTLVQTRWANSPAVFESITILAVPSGSLSKIRMLINSAQMRDFSTSRKTAIALLYTNADTNFASLSSPVVLADSLKKGLQRLSAISNRPEFVNAPLLPCGFAGASRFALACGSAFPSRTAGMVSLRAYLLNPFGVSVAEIPHLVLTGEVSGPDVRNNSAVYFSNQLQAQVLTRRAGGELIRQAIEMNASQTTLSEKTVGQLLAFLSRCIQNRIPANSNPVVGPVALNLIPANSGWLGKANVWNSFTPSNYSISPFSGGAISPATSQWFFDQEDAQQWKEFHVSQFDSVVLSPLPNPVVPYCSGLRPSSISANVYLKTGTVLNPDNYFRLEVSDITGNFDHPVYSARWFGTTLSSGLSDSIIDGIIPDNFSYMTGTTDPNIRRYRIRLVSTSPYYESPNFGETDIPFCGAGGLTKPRVYLSTLRPYKKFYYPGDSIEVMAYKNPESPYTPGNNLRIELSSRSGQFIAGSTTNLFSGIPPFTASAALDSFIIKMKIPDTLSFGPRYRIKAYIDGIPANQGRQTSGNGHDITIVPNQSGTDIQLSTAPVQNVLQTSAISGGVILFDGGSPVLERGVCWSTGPSPTTAGSKSSDGAGIGTYSSNLTALLPGTAYYVRAYARNANGTWYGQEIQFTTQLANQVPILTTDSLSSVGQTEAISGGNITFDGNSAVTIRGVCWSIGSLPTINLSTKTEDGTGVGSFISNLTGLNPGTQYCVRAYAINATGVGYGNEICFSTLSAGVVPPSVSTLAVSALSTCDSAKCGGNVNADGGGAVSARGVVWSTSPQPTVDLPTKTINGAGTGQYSSFLSGLASGTTYFIRAYASNSAGTAYGDEVTITTCVSNRKLSEAPAVFLLPNPASESAQIFSSAELNEVPVVTDLHGKFFAVDAVKTGKSFLLDLRNLPAGSYIIKVVTPKGPAVLPLIKF
jgi:hypothetical protein